MSKKEKIDVEIEIWEDLGTKDLAVGNLALKRITKLLEQRELIK